MTFIMQYQSMVKYMTILGKKILSRIIIFYFNTRWNASMQHMLILRNITESIMPYSLSTMRMAWTNININTLITVWIRDKRMFILRSLSTISQQIDPTTPIIDRGVPFHIRMINGLDDPHLARIQLFLCIWLTRYWNQIVLESLKNYKIQITVFIE